MATLILYQNWLDEMIAILGGSGIANLDGFMISQVAKDETFDLVRLTVREAETDGTLDWIASTYVRDDDMIYDTPHMKGRKLVTFAGVLRYEAFPLAKIVQLVLQYGANEMRRPVEVEFAVRFQPKELKMGNGKW